MQVMADAVCQADPTFYVLHREIVQDTNPIIGTENRIESLELKIEPTNPIIGTGNFFLKILFSNP